VSKQCVCQLHDTKPSLGGRMTSLRHARDSPEFLDVEVVELARLFRASRATGSSNATFPFPEPESDALDRQASIGTCLECHPGSLRGFR
jgi:hypothetical protein